MLIAPNQLHGINELKITLRKKLGKKYLGGAKEILGMKIHMGKSDRKLWLS